MILKLTEKDWTIVKRWTSDYAKNIVKIARRIEFASIYPPNALNEMQTAIIEFDKLQSKEQGGLRLIDILLFLQEQL
jgi:taurine transport system permease protein